MLRNVYRTTFIATAFFAIACGDSTDAVGELGRVEYTLHTDYVVGNDPLTEVRMVTGHPQRILTELTNKGEKKADKPEKLTHRVTPSSGVTVENENFDDDIADFTVTVTDPGEYTIETLYNGDVFDYLEVEFDSPTELELVTWVRAPDAEDFEEAEASGAIQVAEGAQATFLPIPIADDGERLVGDISTDLTATPDDSIVVGENVTAVYEQRVISGQGPVSIYFIEPGTVTVTMTDSSHGVGASRTFDVSGE